MGGALISHLLGNELPGPGTVYKSQQLTFHRAVELGDTLKVSIQAKEKLPDDKTVVFECKALNQREEPVISGVAVVQAPMKKPSIRADLLDDLKYHSRPLFSGPD